MKGSTPPSMTTGLNFDFEEQWSELPLPTKPIAILAEKITYNILGNKQVSEFRTINNLLQIVDGLLLTTQRLLQTMQRLLQTVDGFLQTTQRLLQTVDGLLQTMQRLLQIVDGLLLTMQRLLQIVDGLLEAINGYRQPSNG